MGKRKCQSKYRTSTPSPAEDDFSQPRDINRNADLSQEGSGSSNRAAVHRPFTSVPPLSRPFEVSDSPDNLHSPYHLLNSDHPGLALVSEQLDGTNYGTWIVAMTTSLEAKNKLGFVDGSIPKPAVADPYYKIWCRINSMLKSWLLNGVTKKIYTSILYFSTAAEIWKDLHARFHKSNLPRLYKLRHQLLSLRQGTMDLSSYHTQTQTYWEELSNIQPIATTVEELLAQRETNRVIDFLMGLNESYDHVRSQILMKKTLPTLSEVYNILDNDDSQRSARISPSSGVELSAFQVSSNTGNSQYQRGRPVCTHCGALGHVVDRCYKKHGFPPGFKSKYPKSNNPQTKASANMVTIPASQQTSAPASQKSNSPVALTPDQMQQFIAFFSTQLHNHSVTSSPTPENFVASTSAVSLTPKESGTFLSLYKPTPFCMSFVLASGDAHVPDDSWIIDSGATHHVSHSSSLFSQLTPLTDTFVTLPSGMSESIVGIGSVSLSDKIVLRNVLFVPAFRFNLLSVSSFTSEVDSMISFTSTSCLIQDLTRELMIGKGRRISNLYVLESGSLISANNFSGNKIACSVTADVETWHARLGHPAYTKIDSLSSLLRLKHTKHVKNHHCHVCHLAKQKHLSFPISNTTSVAPFDLLHIDVWGPFSVPTPEGFRYFLTIVDDHSRATWVYLMKLKSDVLFVFPNFLTMIENQFQTRVKAVRSDNAPELSFTDLYKHKGILSFHSCPETPEQNSVVERKHQHILNVARALMFQSHIPLHFWGDCILSAVFLINRLPYPNLDHKSPFQILTSKIPSYDQLKTFGCLCYKSTSPKSRTKFDPRAKACVFIGYPTGIKGYKLFDLETNSISVSRHVLFYENIFPFADSSLSDTAKAFFSCPDKPDAVVPSVRVSSDESSMSSSDVSLPLAVTSTRTRRPPTYLQDYHCNFTSLYPLSRYLTYNKFSSLHFAFINAILLCSEPLNFSEAKKSKEWCNAVDAEFSSLEDLDTWEVCSLPKGKRTVGCKWIFKLKLHADGTVERHKGRLVAKGYTQTEGIDYVETFSPVAKMVTVKMILSLAAKRKWILHQLDISNAFLNGDLHEEIYMDLPPGYAERKGNNLPPNACLRLKKSIYGLKQASRQWFEKFSSAILSLGFEQINGDHTLFLLSSSQGNIILLVYVDDILIASDTEAAVSWFVTQLRSHFKLRDLGVLKYFLGLEIARSASGISICQHKYVLELLTDAGLLGCRPSSVPMDPSVKLSAEDGELLPSAEPYRRLIGKLMYLTTTRPDISFAVNKLCQYSSAPRKPHLYAAHKVLHYLKGTIGQGLFFPADDDYQLTAFCDADWSNCPDTRRSVTGSCIFIGHSLIAWKSKKQDVVSHSSAEAEYRAMSATSKDILWLSRMMADLGCPSPSTPVLFCDSTAALHIAKNSVFHERTKHIERECHAIRERIVAGQLKTLHVRSDNQLADALTKPLYPMVFNKLMSKMGLHNVMTPS